MKIYAIEYIQSDGIFSFYIYTDKWLSERKLIDRSLYWHLKLRFTLPAKTNR